ncbi:hypothetical protein IWZ01DRAFT_483633 [Phyllosticta capitalensis]
MVLLRSKRGVEYSLPAKNSTKRELSDDDRQADSMASKRIKRSSSDLSDSFPKATEKSDHRLAPSDNSEPSRKPEVTKINSTQSSTSTLFGLADPSEGEFDFDKILAQAEEYFTNGLRNVESLKHILTEDDNVRNNPDFRRIMALYRRNGGPFEQFAAQGILEFRLNQEKAKLVQERARLTQEEARLTQEEARVTREEGIVAEEMRRLWGVLNPSLN